MDTWAWVCVAVAAFAGGVWGGAGIGHYQGFKAGFKEGRQVEKTKREAIEFWKQKRLDRLNNKR